MYNDRPYSGVSEIYGHGELLHFVHHAPEMIGYPLIVMFCLGTLVLIYNYFRNRLRFSNTFFFLLLIVAPALLYFAAHSYVWWKGLNASLGLLRVVAAVAPLIGITAVVILQWLAERIKLVRKLRFIIAAVLMRFDAALMFP